MYEFEWRNRREYNIYGRGKDICIKREKQGVLKKEEMCLKLFLLLITFKV